METNFFPPSVPAFLHFGEELLKKKGTLYPYPITLRLGWLSAGKDLIKTKQIARRIQENPSLNKKNLVQIGMGGAILSARMLTELFSPEKKALFVDGLDSHSLSSLLTFLENYPLVLVGSKSGTTLETLLLFRLILHKWGVKIPNSLPLESLQIPSPLPQDLPLVVMTDPGTPLHRYGKEQNLFLVETSLETGGRFSTFTPLGSLLPLLLNLPLPPIEEEISFEEIYQAAGEENQKVVENYLLFLKEILHRKGWGLYPLEGDEFHPFIQFLLQLLGESTGKDGKGVLIVPQKNPHRPYKKDVDRGFLYEIFVWFFLTAYTGFLLRVDPFNEPDVIVAKKWISKLLLKPPEKTEEWRNESSEYKVVYPPSLKPWQFFQTFPPFGYISILSYLPEKEETREVLLQVKREMEERWKKPVWIQWGPRYLHATGQFFKGGPSVGTFLILTEKDEAIPIPGEKISYGYILYLMAVGDRLALREIGRPVIHIHFPRGFSAGKEKFVDLFLQ